MKLFVVALLCAISYAQTVVATLSDGSELQLFAVDRLCDRTNLAYVGSANDLEDCGEKALGLNAEYFTYRADRNRCEIPDASTNVADCTTNSQAASNPNVRNIYQIVPVASPSTTLPQTTTTSTTTTPATTTTTTTTTAATTTTTTTTPATTTTARSTVVNVLCNYPVDMCRMQKIFDDNRGSVTDEAVRFGAIRKRVGRVLRNNVLDDGTMIFAPWIWKNMRTIGNLPYSRGEFWRLEQKFDNLKNYYDLNVRNVVMG